MDLARAFDALATQRRSVRGFLGTPVPQATLRELLALARRALHQPRPSTPAMAST